MKQTFSENQIIQMAQQEEGMLQSRERFYSDLQNVLRETHLSIESLKEIQKKPETIMIKVGPGVIIEAEVKNVKKCKRAFAENGYLEEEIKDTIKWLEEKKVNLEAQAKNVAQDIFKSKQRLSELIGVIKQIEAEKQKNISVK